MSPYRCLICVIAFLHGGGFRLELSFKFYQVRLKTEILYLHFFSSERQRENRVTFRFCTQPEYSNTSTSHYDLTAHRRYLPSTYSYLIYIIPSSHLHLSFLRQISSSSLNIFLIYHLPSLYTIFIIYHLPPIKLFFNPSSLLSSATTQNYSKCHPIIYPLSNVTWKKDILKLRDHLTTNP
jgi:hypothetical protein